MPRWFAMTGGYRKIKSRNMPALLIIRKHIPALLHVFGFINADHDNSLNCGLDKGPIIYYHFNNNNTIIGVVQNSFFVFFTHKNTSLPRTITHNHILYLCAFVNYDAANTENTKQKAVTSSKMLLPDINRFYYESCASIAKLE